MNSVNISGNLTRDPELSYSGDLAICRNGVAVIERKKDGEEWIDVPHFVNFTYFGRRGELLAEKAVKGDLVFVNGRLNFSQWENDEGEKRSKLEVVANTVEGEFQFRKSGEKPVRADAQTTPELPADGTPAPAGEDDIPF